MSAESGVRSFRDAYLPEYSASLSRPRPPSESSGCSRLRLPFRYRRAGAACPRGTHRLQANHFPRSAGRTPAAALAATDLDDAQVVARGNLKLEEFHFP